MKLIGDKTQVRRWVSLGLLAGVVLLGTIIANAEKRGSFQSVESGIVHRPMPFDGHSMCGVGMHSLFGHYTACVTLHTPSLTAPINRSVQGVIEYQFLEGDAMYGNVQLKPRTPNGPWMVDIVFTGGTGLFRHASGHATGYMRASATDIGVQTYTLELEGLVDTEK